LIFFSPWCQTGLYLALIILRIFILVEELTGGNKMMVKIASKDFCGKMIVAKWHASSNEYERQFIGRKTIFWHAISADIRHAIRRTKNFK
jgi:hypothetical protein